MYSQYGGVVLDEEEGDHIVKALGNKKVRLRPHTPSHTDSILIPCVGCDLAGSCRTLHSMVAWLPC